MENHEHADDGKVHAHISSFNFYVGIFTALIFFTILTVAVSYVHLGPANLAVAIVIASIKAGLVVTFFMHLKYDSKFNALMFVSGLLFIGVFFAMTMNDTERRTDEINDVSGNKIYLGETNETQAPGGFEVPKWKTEHPSSGHESKGHEESGDKATHH